MNTFSGRVITLFTIFVLIFSQVQPTGARQATQDTGTATPTDQPTQTATPADQATQTPGLTPTDSASATPTDEATQTTTPTPDTTGALTLNLTANPAFVTSLASPDNPQSVTVGWAIDGTLPEGTTASLKVTLPDGYTPDDASIPQNAYNAAEHVLTLPVGVATSGQFVIDVTAPIENASISAVLLNGDGQSITNKTLTLPTHIAATLSFLADPAYVTNRASAANPQSVTVNWSVAGELTQPAAWTLKITLADGYAPDAASIPQDAYDTASHILTLPVTAANGQFVISVTAPVASASFPAQLLDENGQSLASPTLSLPIDISLSANPAAVSSFASAANPESVTVNWTIAGALSRPADTTLNLTLADGYTPVIAPDSGQTYDTTSHLLTLPVTATSGLFVIQVTNPLDTVTFTANLMNGADTPPTTTLTLTKNTVSLSLSADPTFVTSLAAPDNPQSVTVGWAIDGTLPEGTTASLQVSLPDGYTPEDASIPQDAYDAANHQLTLPIAVATSGQFVIDVTAPVENARIPAVLLNGDGQSITDTTLTLPTHIDATLSFSADPAYVTNQASAANPESVTVNWSVAGELAQPTAWKLKITLLDGYAPDAASIPQDAYDTASHILTLPVTDTGGEFVIDVTAPVKDPDLSAQLLDENEQSLASAAIFLPKNDLSDLSMSASPAYVTNDGTPQNPHTVTVNWTINGTLPQDANSTLQVTLADGFTPDEALNPGQIYDETKHLLTLTLPVTATGGQFTLDVTNPTGDANFTASILDADGVDLADAALALPVHEIVEVPAGSDKTISARGGQLQIGFGPGSVTRAMTVEVSAPVDSAISTTSMGGTPFEIDAHYVADGKAVTNFPDGTEVTLHVSYGKTDLSGVDESNLSLYWYDTDPDVQDWVEIPTIVDPDTKTLSATSTHLGLLDKGINNWQAARTPTVKDFQTSQFTGAASYSLPIEVPQGPGGFQPNLSVSYNSQVIDQSTAQTQASWVGMGWSLDMNSIQLDDHGTNQMNMTCPTNTPDCFTNDDTWSVNVNGISGKIVKDTDGSYHATNENFVKFEFDPAGANSTGDTWTVWDKSGNVYRFTKKVQTIYQKGANSQADCGYALVTYQWYLTSMANLFGKEITYTYKDDTKNVDGEQWDGDKHCQHKVHNSLITATYPLTITYPNLLYRIRFDLEPRTDYKAGWASPKDNSYHVFEQSRLQGISVLKRENTDQPFNTTIRQYVFTYYDQDLSNPPAPIWPGIKWSKGGHTLTLKNIQEFGEGGEDDKKSLPATTFTYGDQMHLTHADNGYGGNVDFTYEPLAYPYRGRDSQTYNQDFSDGSTGCDTGGFGGAAYCDPQGNGADFLRVYGQATNTALLNTGVAVGQNNPIRPGGFYQFTFYGLSYVRTKTNAVALSYGFGYQPDPTHPTKPAQNAIHYHTPCNYQTNPANNKICDDYMVGSISVRMLKLPVSASIADVVLKATNTSAATRKVAYATFKSFKVELLTSIYRVTTRTVTDGVGSSYTYHYTYVGAALNGATDKGTAWNGSTLTDPKASVSLSACKDAQLDNKKNGKSWPTCAQYTEKYSEFRGHSQVTETDPNGRKTVTMFYQDDDKEGRTKEVDVSDGSKLLSKQSTTYTVNALTMNALYYYDKANNRLLQYAGISHKFIATDSEENYTYADASNNYSATKTEYAYTSYGNLLNKTESSGKPSGSTTSWTTYRITSMTYEPTNTGEKYLVGLQASQTVTNSSYVLQSKTLNLYDGATNSTNTAAKVGKLTAVRTWVAGNNYDQISYGYNDRWGNRTYVTTYKTNATDIADPTDTGYTTTTTFDSTYGTYPVVQTNAKNQSVVTYYDCTLGLPTSQSNLFRTVQAAPQNACTETPGFSADLSQTSRAKYDAFGRMTALSKPGESDSTPSFTVEYADTIPFTAKLAQKVDEQTAGTTWAYSTRYYDGMGRQYKTETSGAGVDTQWAKTLLSVTTTSFDADGHPTSQSTPYINAGDARYTTTSYDVLGRPQTVTAPDNTPTHYYYNTEAISVADANGNATWTTDVASVTDGIGHTTTTIKDVWGNTIQVISPVKDIITKEKIDPGASYAYDVLGRLTDAKRGNTKTHMDYDGAGHKIDMHDPDMGSWNYWYDSQGNLTTQKDARGCTISLNYDELSRLINKSDCNTLVVIETYNYDEPGHSYLSSDDDYSIGHRTSMATSGTTTSTNWFYDVRGQMRKEDKVIYVPVGGQPVSQSFETKFDYNDAGLLTSTTYPDNEVVTTRYDSRMLLYSAASDPSHDSTQYVISTDYDLASRILSQTYGNGMQTKWNYNPWDTQGGRLHNVTTKSSTLPLVNGPTTIQNLTYAYDPLGNINTITDDSRNQTQAFRYDALNRLTCASAGVSVTPAPTCNPNTDSGSDANGIYNQNYGYDPGTGNLTSKGGQSYTYDPSHPHAVSALGNNTYNYDPNGNQTTRTVNGKRYSLGYDAEGRLVSVNAQAGAQSQSLLRSNPLPAATSTTLAPVTPTATPTTSVLKTATARPSGTPTPAVTSTRTASATATKTPQTGGQAPAANVFQAAYKQKAALIISTAPVTPIPVATALSFHPVTSWTFDTTVQGWAGSSTDVSGFGWRSGGYIGASIIGNDPLIYSAAGLNVNITNNPYIRISYKNTTPSNIATFYYMTGSDTGFTLAKYKSFIVYPNSDYTTYLVDMSTVASWTGTLTRLRFDPAGTYSGSFGVDYIQIGYVTIVTLTPTNTPTPITPTLTPTKTPTPITPTLTPTRTSTLTDTPTKTLTLTLTPTDTPTKTLTPTLTPTKTPTDTPTDTPTKTLTPTLTPTKTLTPTLTPTDTQTKTLTPTVMPTDTPTPTPTPVPFSATFTYDADGNMASATMNGVTTLYVSTSYQVQVTGTDSVVTKYYPGGAFSVGGVLYYALTDQVGSTTAVVSATSVMETRYDAWGQVRYADDKLPTDRTYTGQRSYMGDASTGAAQGFGLMYYNARWYDPYITHFSQPDSIIPDGVQGYDRYAYANNNPIMHSDPSGHWAIPLILIGVAIVGVVALTAGAILYATNPEARRSIDGMAALTGQGIAAAQSKMQTDASITVLAVDVLLAKAKPPKPLTPDEQDKIKHIGEDTEPFLDKHPDAGAEAAKKAAGEDTGEYDHANELDEFMRGVQNDMDHLESVRPFRDAESQAAIDNALNQGQDWVQRARKILGMD